MVIILKNPGTTKRGIFLLLLCVFALFRSNAHVNLINPVGGETFYPGDILNIQWQNSRTHDPLNWDLLFSSDGGSTWDSIQLNIDTGTLNYFWIVPATQTLQGRIKIVQDNIGMDYSQSSENFTIGTVVSINEMYDKGALNVYPNPLTEYVIFEFDNSRQESHKLTLYDMQGRLVREITQIKTDKVKIKRNNLKPGLYFFQLRNHRKVRATGKLIIK